MSGVLIKNQTCLGVGDLAFGTLIIVFKTTTAATCFRPMRLFYFFVVVVDAKKPHGLPNHGADALSTLA